MGGLGDTINQIVKVVDDADKSALVEPPRAFASQQNYGGLVEEETKNEVVVLEKI